MVRKEKLVSQLNEMVLWLEHIYGFKCKVCNGPMIPSSSGPDGITYVCRASSKDFLKHSIFSKKHREISDHYIKSICFDVENDKNKFNFTIIALKRILNNEKWDDPMGEMADFYTSWSIKSLFGEEGGGQR